jgi:hypothetical protein
MKLHGSEYWERKVAIFVSICMTLAFRFTLSFLLFYFYLLSINVEHKLIRYWRCCDTGMYRAYKRCPSEDGKCPLLFWNFIFFDVFSATILDYQSEIIMIILAIAFYFVPVPQRFLGHIILLTLSEVRIQNLTTFYSNYWRIFFFGWGACIIRTQIPLFFTLKKI